MKKMCIILLGIFFVMSLAFSAYAAKEVKFGVVTYLTGGAALMGTNLWRGAQIACEDFNTKGGVTVGGEKYLLNPIVFDNEGKPEKALAGAKKISSIDKVPFILVTGSLEAFPIMAVNEKEGFILGAVSQSPPFTEKGNKLVIRLCNNVKRTMNPWVKFVLKALEKKNVSVTSAGVMILNTELGRYWSNEFVKEWEAAGKKIVEKVSYSPDEPDYYTQLTAIMGKKPDVIVLTSAGEVSARVIKQARQLGYNKIFLNSIAGDPLQLNSLVPPDQLAGTFVEVGRWSYQEEPVKVFIKKYQAKYPGEVAQFMAGFAYEGVRLFAKALEIAGTTTDIYKIRAAFPKALPLSDSFFLFQDMNEAGDVLMPVFLVEFKDGKILPVKD